MLYSLTFLQKHGIIHCDFKPENILLRQEGKTGIKLIDFGSSCFSGEKLYTYIQSRFYRAPEIILDLGYDIEIDMWSFGCVLVELYAGIPIFPGENERDQLYYMIEYFGIPDVELINDSVKKSNFFTEDNMTLEIPNSRGKIRKPNTKKLKKFLKGADDDFIDLIEKCFQYNQSYRIKPAEAILHPWITCGMPLEILSYHKTNLKMNFRSINVVEEENKDEYIATDTNVLKTDHVSSIVHFPKANSLKFKSIKGNFKSPNIYLSINVGNHKKQSNSFTKK
jgi:dual specificity tyrosine-phosphorylation-regulated kinase 2/3/4